MVVNRKYQQYNKNAVYEKRWGGQGINISHVSRDVHYNDWVWLQSQGLSLAGMKNQKADNMA